MAEDPVENLEDYEDDDDEANLEMDSMLLAAVPNDEYEDESESEEEGK